MAAFRHVSVLLNECIRELKIRPDGIYVDGTLGGGGHSYEIASRLTTGRLYGIDRDMDAIRAAGERLEEFEDCFTPLHGNYGNMRALLGNVGVTKVDGILLDLGVSSYQLDEAERGFSYMNPEAPLDMRMDRSEGITAEEIINTYDEQTLYEVIKTYGEERFAKAIARNITKAREKSPLKTAGDLNAVIEASIPAKSKRTGGHPAKRTYQALRIETNDELSVLKESLEGMIDLLDEGGRLCVITFHSLEDRIVKQAFKRAQEPCICPKEFPVCVCAKKSKGTIITRKPILPGEEEVEANSRAKSAKLRVFEKGKRSNPTKRCVRRQGVKDEV